jgi:hypothetical protein
MTKYRIITRQYVYQAAEVEANTQAEAEKIAIESDALDWDWVDYGNTEIEHSERA